MNIYIELNEEDGIEVELTGDTKIVDESFSHEFGTEEQYSTICEEITYDRTMYCKENQAIIDKYIEDNFETLATQFEEEYEPDCYEPDYDDYDYEDDRY